MSKITYARTSPYANTPQTSNQMLNYVHRRIPASSDDTLMVLDARHSYRPDKLSQELYGTPSLWWVFMVRNLSVIRDPLNDFQAGLTIYAPSYTQLKKVLGL